MLDIARPGGQTSDVEPVHISYYCVLLIYCIILIHSGLYVRGRKALHTQVMCFVFIVPLLVINMTRTCAAHGTFTVAYVAMGGNGCSHDGYYGMGGVRRVAGTFLGRAQMLDATEHQGYVGWAPLAC